MLNVSAFFDLPGRSGENVAPVPAKVVLPMKK
jgi:hypothetical protein